MIDNGLGHFLLRLHYLCATLNDKLSDPKTQTKKSVLNEGTSSLSPMAYSACPGIIELVSSCLCSSDLTTNNKGLVLAR